MRLHECLQQIAESHPDLVLINLASFDGKPDRRGTAAEMMARLKDWSGYEIRTQKHNYGRTTKIVIGFIGGLNALVEE